MTERSLADRPFFPKDSMARLIWTPDRLRDFAQRWNNLAPVDDIGEEFGLSVPSVYQHASKLGLPRRTWFPTISFAEFDVRLRSLGGYRDITRAEAAALGPLPLSAPLPPRPSTYTPRSC